MKNINNAYKLFKYNLKSDKKLSELLLLKKNIIFPFYNSSGKINWNIEYNYNSNNKYDFSLNTKIKVAKINNNYNFVKNPELLKLINFQNKKLDLNKSNNIEVYDFNFNDIHIEKNTINNNNTKKEVIFDITKIGSNYYSFIYFYKLDNIDVKMNLKPFSIYYAKENEMILFKTSRDTKIELSLNKKDDNKESEIGMLEMRYYS